MRFVGGSTPQQPPLVTHPCHPLAPEAARLRQPAPPAHAARPLVQRVRTAPAPGRLVQSRPAPEGSSRAARRRSGSLARTQTEVRHLWLWGWRLPCTTGRPLTGPPTCVMMALAAAMRSRPATSAAANESAMHTAAQPASTMPRYATTAVAVMGIMTATASPAWRKLQQRSGRVASTESACQEVIPQHAKSGEAVEACSGQGWPT